MENVVVLVDSQLLLLDGLLDGVCGVEDFVEFFELFVGCTMLDMVSFSGKGTYATYSAVLGLWHHKVNDNGLDNAPAAEDDVGSPGDVVESNGDTELVGHQRY